MVYFSLSLSRGNLARIKAHAHHYLVWEFGFSEFSSECVYTLYIGHETVLIDGDALRNLVIVILIDLQYYQL